MSDDSLAAITRALRAHLADHNFRVALLTFLTLLAAIALWFALHFVLRWLTVLFATVAQGTEAQMPRFVEPLFWVVAATLLVLAAIDRRFRRDDRARDTKSAREIAWDFLLAIPRVTFGVASTLTNWQHLTDHELRTAAELIQRLRTDRRIALHTLPLEIPNEALREKVLFALQLTQLVEVRRDNREFWLTLNPLRPSNFLPGPRETRRS